MKIRFFFINSDKYDAPDFSEDFLCGVFVREPYVYKAYKDKYFIDISYKDQSYLLDVIISFLSDNYVFNSLYILEKGRFVNILSDKKLTEQIIFAKKEDYYIPDMNDFQGHYNLLNCYKNTNYRNIYNESCNISSLGELLHSIFYVEKNIFPKALSILVPWYESLYS